MESAVPLVAVIMGSKSDWETMRQADEVLAQFGVPHECRVLSAHRTPAQTAEYVRGAEGRGMEVIIAAAGGAAHLAGGCAAPTGLPAGMPVGTLGTGGAGARNAALLAVAVLANSRPELIEKLRQFRAEQSQKVLRETLP